MSGLFEAWFASGRIIDWILLLVAAEAALLAWSQARGGREPRLTSVAPTLVSGALLLVSLKSALVGLWWGWIALTLFLALLAHLADLALRWRGSARAERRLSED